VVKDKVRAKIERLEAELKDLAESRRLRAEQMTAFETEQRREMVDARVHKIEAAQANVDRLSAEIAKLRTEDAWDCAAIEEMSTNLAEEKAALRREQWQTRCATVNRLLESRAKGVLEQRLLDLALQLKQTAAEIAESDKEIGGALGSIHRSLARDADEFPYRDSWRRTALSYLLKDVVETPACREPLDTARMQELAVDFFDLLKRHVNEVAEIEPAVEVG
jgi:chromosome segregation ATPase